jgi:hypothetical protein
MMEKQYQQSTQDLAEAAQNPIAAMISLPLQNNIYGEVGPNHNATGNVLNIQPVIPITLSDRNIISRTIAPLIYQPSLATLPSETFELGQFNSSHFGLEDINQSFFWPVPSELADHHRELGSTIEQVGFSDRRWLWQDFQDRRAADEF